MPEKSLIIFMGTPDFAVPIFTALRSRYPIVGVVTQPDRPAGRGRSLRPPPVKQAALAHDLPVFQPESLRTPQAVAHLRAWAPDVIVTAATGHILTAKVLALPTRGTLNVHASLLPRWRGAAPIHAAIRAGDTETGITIMCTDEGLDTGPILSQRSIAIAPRETTASLHDRLAQLGADLLLETLPRWLSLELTPRPQPDRGVTLAHRIRKADGRIRWDQPAVDIDRHVRAFTPWPGAFSFWGERRLKVIAAFPLPSSPAGAVDETHSAPGSVVRVGDLPAVVTAAGLLRLDTLQLAGKRALPGAEFVRGQPDFIGSRLE